MIGVHGNYSFVKTATRDTTLPGFLAPLQAGTRVAACYVSTLTEFTDTHGLY